MGDGGLARCADGCPQVDICEQRFKSLEARLDSHDGRWRELNESLTKVREKLSSLEGRLAGYLVAASLLGTVVAFIAAYVLRAK
jgi:chromosome segregation ATPase